MPNKIIDDLTGKEFGKLTVISRASNTKNGSVMWWVMCDCGSEKTVRGMDLKSGATISCGCVRKANRSKYLSNFNNAPWKK